MEAFKKTKLEKLKAFGKKGVIPFAERALSSLSIIALVGISGTLICKMIFDHLRRQKSGEGIRQIFLGHERRILIALVSLLIALVVFKILHQIVKAVNFHLNEDQKTMGVGGEFKKVSVIEKVRSIRNSVLFSAMAFGLFFIPACCLTNHLMKETAQSFKLMENTTKFIGIICIAIFVLALLWAISKLCVCLNEKIVKSMNNPDSIWNKKSSLILKVLLAIVMLPLMVLELVFKAVMYAVNGVTDFITKRYSQKAFDEYAGYLWEKENRDASSVLHSGGDFFEKANSFVVKHVDDLKGRTRELFFDMA